MNWHKLIWSGVAVLWGAAQIALLTLKLTGHIDWSWWWILAPLWSPLACIAVVGVIGIALLGNASSNGGNPFR